MKVYYNTDRGLLRENNEDNLTVDITQKYCLFAVADGMGGHRAGEIASLIAIDTIKESFKQSINRENFKAPMFINDSIQLANSKIRQESGNKEEYSGMGTTVTMAVIDLPSNTAYIGNVGDSRTYIIRNKEIIQITEDHTYVHALEREGKITGEEVKIHPKRNIITRAVGSEEIILTDIFEIEILEGDILLLCSDGLTTHVSDSQILNTITNYGCSQSVDRLIKLSNDNGGTDNITIIIVDTNSRGENDDR